MKGKRPFLVVLILFVLTAVLLVSEPFTAVAEPHGLRNVWANTYRDRNGRLPAAAARPWRMGVAVRRGLDHQWSICDL